jgi:protein SCO1/2
MPTRREIITGRFDERAMALRTAQASQSGKSYGAEYFSNLTLITHQGKKVRFYDDLIRGKIVAINMMYAQCDDICPMMTANLANVQKLLGERAGRDIFMYSITLKPEQDTPRDLQKYAELHGVKPGWLFLTGARADIERLRVRLGFFDRNPRVDRNVSTHTGMVRVGNDVYDRWTMSPALAEPKQILAAINHVDKSIVHTGGSPRGL